MEAAAKADLERAETLFLSGDLAGAMRATAEARRICPRLPGVEHAAAAYKIHADGREKDWIAVLGLTPATADADAIKKKYRKLSVLVHPDKNGSAAADGAFKLLHEAFAQLTVAADLRRPASNASAGAARSYRPAWRCPGCRYDFFIDGAGEPPATCPRCGIKLAHPWRHREAAPPETTAEEYDDDEDLVPTCWDDEEEEEPSSESPPPPRKAQCPACSSIFELPVDGHDGDLRCPSCRVSAASVEKVGKAAGAAAKGPAKSEKPSFCRNCGEPYWAGKSKKPQCKKCDEAYGEIEAKKPPKGSSGGGRLGGKKRAGGGW